MNARGGCVPANAWDGLLEEGKEPVYIARAEHQGQLIPGTLIPSMGVAYVSWGALAHSKEAYQVLVKSNNCNLSWQARSGVQSSPVQVPEGAVLGGYNLNNQDLSLYVCSKDTSALGITHK